MLHAVLLFDLKGKFDTVTFETVKFIIFSDLLVFFFFLNQYTKRKALFLPSVYGVGSPILPATSSARLTTSISKIMTTLLSLNVNMNNWEWLSVVVKYII